MKTKQIYVCDYYILHITSLPKTCRVDQYSILNSCDQTDNILCIWKSAFNRLGAKKRKTRRGVSTTGTRKSI